jgi:hypothetical protein
MILGLGNTIPSDSVRQGLGGGGGGGFTNTYSLAFDGVDDFIGFSPLEFSAEFTLSAWVKPVSLSANQGNIISSATSNANKIGISSASSVQVKLGGILSTITDGGSNNFSIGVWQHILIIRDSSNIVTVFRNGSAFGSPSSANAGTGTYDSIGKFNNTQFLDEQLDEVAYWTSDQSANIASIYSASGAVDLSSLNPTVWYRMGDNGSYKSPQWLIPNNSNKDKVSNYSFEFDGIDDEISLSSSFVAAGEFTLSLWIKPTVLDSNQNILGNGTSSQNWINPSSATTIRVKPAGTLLNFLETGTNKILEDWNHILIYRDSSNNIGIFVNGETFSSTQNNSNTLTLQTIGRGVNKWFSGNIDEVAFWNTNKSSVISSIYSGGTPSDLSSLSPVAYYKMGEEATFVYNVNPEGTWTIPDAVGSNDGTSNNTFLDTGRVGDAPNSTSNAVSFNMLETDRKEDTPPTP